MFPLRWNFPFRKKDGSLVNIEDAMGGDYTLPTASSSTKGGVKVGHGLSMEGEALNRDDELPGYSSTESGKVLGVDSEGALEWKEAGGGGSSIVCKRGTQNFNLSANGWNSFIVTFDSDFADTNYTWLYSITVTSAQTESSKIPINIFVKTKNVGSISGRIYNANDELITGLVEWVAIHI